MAGIYAYRTRPFVLIISRIDSLGEVSTRSWKKVIRVIDNKFSTILGARLIKISQVSRDTGISRTTLTNIYYKRSTYITFAVLNKLCEYLDCSVNDLFLYIAETTTDMEKERLTP